MKNGSLQKGRLTLTIQLLVFSSILSVFLAGNALAAKRFTSPPASKEYWNVFCNKKGRNIELGIHQPNYNYYRMAGPFNGEPAARNWVNYNCSSWRCDQNGRCIRQNTNRGCPPGTYYQSSTFGQGRCIPRR